MALNINNHLITKENEGGAPLGQVGQFSVKPFCETELENRNPQIRKGLNN